MRSVVVLVSMVVTCAAPALVGAQPFTTVTRTGSPRETERGGVRTTVLPSQPIGLRDCLSDEEWTMMVTYTATAGTATALQYWIGGEAMSCAMSAQRYNNANPRCWPIRQTPSLTVNNPTNPFSYTVRIKSRYLIDPIMGNCMAPSISLGQVGSVYLSLLTVPLNDSSLYGMSLPITFDLTPPDAPTAVTASRGESQASLQWTNRGANTGTTDEAGVSTVAQDLQGFWVLCDPPPPANLDGGVADAGMTVADAGSNEHTFGDDGGVSSTCGKGSFQLDPNNDALFRRHVCSDLISPAATRETVHGLTNGQAYRFLVVAQDLAGNRSVSETSNCVTPGPVNDFWEQYRGAGGGAEPLRCSATVGGRAGVATCVVIAGVLAGVWARSRRRRVR